MVSPATVTECSCMASRRAAWVFGVARLISSARTMEAKRGPFWKRKLLPSSVRTRMLVPVISAGMRSGVNWMREKGRSSTFDSTRTRWVLPRPGTPSSSTLPPATTARSRCSTTSSWPIISFAISVRIFSYCSAKWVILSMVLLLCCVVSGESRPLRGREGLHCCVVSGGRRLHSFGMVIPQ